MRLRHVSRIHRAAASALLLSALLTMTLPYTAIAADALIPQVGSDEIEPIVQQSGPAASGPSSNQLVPTTEFVEDPTRQAGGEDDAQRANERQFDQRNGDDDHRRK